MQNAHVPILDLFVFLAKLEAASTFLNVFDQ